VNTSELLEKLSHGLPKKLREPLVEHVKSLRDLIEGELETARKSPDREVKLAVTKKVINICSAACTTVAIEPIPLADFPILTSVQVLMVASIMRVSGREISGKAIGEFLSALGINIGAGLVLREGARAAVKVLPGFGNAISGAIAGGATFALGRAATAYFIEERPLPEVRKYLQLVKLPRMPRFRKTKTPAAPLLLPAPGDSDPEKK
jgi:uncharacterized protein (DUF697 family)